MLSNITVKRIALHLGGLALWICPLARAAQEQSAPPAASAPAGQTRAQGPVSYASMNEVNALLGQLDSTAQSTVADLGKVRINKWKADSDTKQQAEANAQSVIRNLQSAFPGMISAVRAAPEDLPASFKLYRTLDALYDVLSSLTESTGAFGSKSDYQALSEDVNNFERLRRGFADRLENLASNKQAEISQLRNELRAAQAAAAPAGAPKKVIVDDNEPPPVKKHVRKKKPTTSAAENQPGAQPNAKPATPQQ